MSRLLLMLSLLVSFQNLLSQQFTGQVIDDGVSIGYGLAIGDVDGDGLDDIILADKKAFVWYQNPNWDKHVIIENLTERDNVCLAARDINNDGKKDSTDSYLMNRRKAVSKAIAKKRGKVKEGFSAWRIDLDFNEQVKK